MSTVVYGRNVTFTATVTANRRGSGTPTGTVTYYDGTNVLGICTLNRSGRRDSPCRRWRWGGTR